MNKIPIFKRLTNKFKIQNGNDVNIARNAKLSGCKIVVKGTNNLLLIEDNTILRDVTLEIIGNNCSIQIGQNCMIGHNCYLSAKEENIHLIIKNNSGLSRNVKIMTSDGHPIYSNGIRINNPRSICIENHVWIADNVTILKGVNIYEGAVIGINSTVTKNVPSHAIAAGNPAKIIRENIAWDA